MEKQSLVMLLAAGGLVAVAGCSESNHDSPPPVDAAKVAAARHPADSPFLPLTFTEALHRAATDNKPILVDFYTDHCGPCKWMDANTWNQADLLEWLDARAVCIKYNATDDRSLAVRYNVSAYPTMIVVGTDAAELGRVRGSHDAQRLKQALGPLLPDTD